MVPKPEAVAEKGFERGYIVSWGPNRTSGSVLNGPEPYWIRPAHRINCMLP